MPSSTVDKKLPHFLRVLAAGSIAGALVSMAGCHWLLFEHWEEDLEFCDEIYEDCLSYAVTDADKALCVEDVEYCYESCDAEWPGQDDDDDDDDGDGDGDGDDDGDGDGDGDPGDGDGDPGVCIDLFGSCVDLAETLQDVEACEALYDQCIDPGDCTDPECGCPADDLQACIDSYSSCNDLADTPEKVEVCTDAFDECTAPFAEVCAVDENPNLDPCLEQHQLCIDCAEGDEQVELCQVVFASCMSQPT